VLGNAILGLVVVIALFLARPDLVRFLAASWLALGIAYAVLVGAASIVAAFRNGIDLLPLLPPVFFVYHTSYGAGFCAGVWHFLVSPRTGVSDNSRFARLTR
jgi:hypothetical protein